MFGKVCSQPIACSLTLTFKSRRSRRNNSLEYHLWKTLYSKWTIMYKPVHSTPVMLYLHFVPHSLSPRGRSYLLFVNIDNIFVVSAPLSPWLLIWHSSRTPDPHDGRRGRPWPTLTQYSRSCPASPLSWWSLLTMMVMPIPDSDTWCCVSLSHNDSPGLVPTFPWSLDNERTSRED